MNFVGKNNRERKRADDRHMSMKQWSFLFYIKFPKNNFLYDEANAMKTKKFKIHFANECVL